MNRRQFLKFALGAAPAALAGAVAVRAGVEAYSFQITHHERSIRGLKRPLTVAFLTDTHLGPYMHLKQLRGWVEATNALGADLILLGGDLVDQFYGGELEGVPELLATLKSRLGTYAVLGNHDRTRYRNLQPLKDAYEEAGVRLLINEGVSVRDDLYLAGIDDWRTGYPEPGRALAGAPTGSGAARLLLTHNPDAIPDLPAGLDLVLAGHTHGGQVRLPVVGPLATSSEYGRRFVEGWVEAPMPAFVSRGLGVTLLPFRLLCPAELVLLSLSPA